MDGEIEDEEVGDEDDEDKVEDKDEGGDEPFV